MQHAIFACCTDLGAESSWRDVRDWCDHYGLPMDFVWPVYKSASSALLERIFKKTDVKPAKTK